VYVQGVELRTRIADRTVLKKTAEARRDIELQRVGDAVKQPQNSETGEPGGARGSQGKPGGPRRTQEDPGGPRGEQGGARGEPGGAGEKPRGAPGLY